MFGSIADDIRRELNYGNRITRLVIFNIAIFIAINLVRLFYTISSGFSPGLGFQEFLKYVALSSDLVFDVTHPWVFLTHMFVHVGFFHVLFNMLFLYWFGRITADFLGDHRIYPIYFLSGFAGALIYLITSPLIGGGSIAYGASAAVMGVVVSAAAIAPDYTMRLLFLGDVKLKYIALVLVLLDVFALGSMANFGGHAGHIGGAAFGWLFVTMLKQGTDMSVPFNNLIGWFQGILSGKPRKTNRRTKRNKVFVRESNVRKKGGHKADNAPRQADQQARIDAILDKIKAKGYDSLSEEEKEFLFKASKK